MGKTENEILNMHFTGFSEPDKILKLCFRAHESILAKTTNNLVYNGFEALSELKLSSRLSIVSNCQKQYLQIFNRKYGRNLFSNTKCYKFDEESKIDNIKSIMENEDDQSIIYYYIGDTLFDKLISDELNIPFIGANYGFGILDDSITKFDSLREIISYCKTL